MINSNFNFIDQRIYDNSLFFLYRLFLILNDLSSPCSLVVEHSLRKRKVVSSILIGGMTESFFLFFSVEVCTTTTFTILCQRQFVNREL